MINTHILTPSEEVFSQLSLLTMKYASHYNSSLMFRTNATHRTGSTSVKQPDDIAYQQTHVEKCVTRDATRFHSVHECHNLNKTMVTECLVMERIKS